MAFGWFRRRQKMVIILMAVLMVSFLIGFQGFEKLFEVDPRKQAIGRLPEGKITALDLEAARSDTEILKLFARGDSMLPMLLQLNGDKGTDLAYALLLKEAERSDIRVSDADIEGYFAENEYRGGQYDWLISYMKQNHRVTEKRLKAVVKDWLMIRKAFLASLVTTVPSDEEMRHAFRDLNEKIKLRVAEVSADDYLKDVPEPNQQAVQDQFDRYRGVLKGTVLEGRPFGFGYRQPDRVALQCLFINGAAISRVTKPAEEKIRAYYLDKEHKDEFLKKPPETQASAPATREAGGQMTLEEARPLIVAKLAPEASENRIEEVTAKAEALLDEIVRKGDANDPFKLVAERMRLPADDVLAKPVNLLVENEPLDKAIEKLADAAGLDAICYPWDVRGEVQISPLLRVSIRPEPGKVLKLSDALKDITEQLRGAMAATQPTTEPNTPASGPQTQPTTKKSDIPDLKWARCLGFDKVLFPAEGIELFPVQARQTPLMDPEQFGADDILRASLTALRSGHPLWHYPFMAEPFVRDQRPVPAMKVGETGPKMLVLGTKSGRLLWRLVEAVPSRAPDRIDDVEGLRKQVVEDLKTQEAFAVAAKRAEDIKKASAQLTLEGAAKATGAKVFETDFFSRKIRGRRSYYSPVEYFWSQVPKLEMPSAQLQTQLINQAFSLAPEKVEPPFPKESPTISVLAVPPKKIVLVFQRIDFIPALIAEYEESRETGRMAIAQELRGRQIGVFQAWFVLDYIQRRVGYEPVRS